MKKTYRQKELTLIKRHKYMCRVCIYQRLDMSKLVYNFLILSAITLRYLGTR